MLFEPLISWSKCCTFNHKTDLREPLSNPVITKWIHKFGPFIFVYVMNSNSKMLNEPSLIIKLKTVKVEVNSLLFMSLGRKSRKTFENVLIHRLDFFIRFYWNASATVLFGQSRTKHNELLKHFFLNVLQHTGKHLSLLCMLLLWRDLFPHTCLWCCAGEKYLKRSDESLSSQ